MRDKTMKKTKSILVNGKDFPLSPDRTEVLDILVGNYPAQTTFTRSEIKDVTDGQLGTAFSTLAGNAVSMIGTDTGRKTLVAASGIAILGAFARSRFPQLKLGGSKLYFRL